MTRLQWDRLAVGVWAGVGALFLAVAVVAGFHTFSAGFPQWINWTPDVAASVMSGAGAVSVIFFGFATWTNSQIAKRSENYLSLAMEGVRRAFDVLEADKPTRNIAWVNAARLIRRVLKVARHISEKDHDETWRLFREEWRVRFITFLDADIGYYFGVDPLQSAPAKIEVTDEVLAKLATRSVRERELIIGGLDASNDDTTMISSRRALKTIIDFVTQYDLQDEALDGVTAITDADREGLLMSDHHGLFAYLDTISRYTFIGGKAHKNESPTED